MTATVDVPTAERPPIQQTPSISGGASRSQVRALRPPADLSSSRTRRLSPRARKWLVATHVLVGVGWFGIVLAKLVLEIVVLAASDQDVARTGYVFMAELDRTVFPPAAIVTLITGIVLSVGTTWGLFRHW